MENIQRIQAQTLKDEKERAAALANLKKSVEDVRREHELSQTEMGQIVLKTEKLNELQEEQRKIRERINAGTKVNAEDIKKIAENEKEVLSIQKEIADILENKVKEAVEAELDARKKSIDALNDEIEPLKKISDTQKDILDDIEKQLEVQKEKVAEAEKEARVFDKFRADLEHASFEFKGVGDFGLKSSELRREFRMLKQEGKNFRLATQEDVDAGKARNVGDKIRIRNLREFQKHVEDQMAKADQKLQDEIVAKNKLIKAEEEAKKKKKEADEEMAELLKKRKEEQDALIEAQEKLLDREEKTIKELTKARIDLEKALREFRNVAVGAKNPVAPALGVAMAGIGVKLGNAGGDLGKAVAPDLESGLFDIDLKPTETELVAANKTLITMNATLEGKFVNQ